MKSARVGVRILPLLRGKSYITEIKVKGLSVLLVENEKDAVNWSSQTPAESKPEPPAQSKPPAEEHQLELTSDLFLKVQVNCLKKYLITTNLIFSILIVKMTEKIDSSFFYHLVENIPDVK